MLYKLMLNDKALKSSENDQLRNFVDEKNATFKTTNPDELCFNRDAIGGSFSLNSETTQKADTDMLLAKHFNKENQSLIKSNHYQDPLGCVFKSILLSGLKFPNQITACDYSANYSEVGGKVFLDTQINDIQFGEPSFYAEKNNNTKVSGSVNVRYQLNNDGYKLDSISTSNSVLKNMLLGNHDYLPTPTELAAAPKEDFKSAQLDLKAAIEDQNTDPLMAAHAKAVYKAVSKRQDKKPAETEELTTLLNETTHLVKNPSDTKSVKAYMDKAKKTVGHRSAKKLVGAAMLGFVGAVVLVGSVVGVAATVGLTSPAGAAGIITGASLLAKSLAIAGASLHLGGSFLGSMGMLFSGRKKGVADKMDKLAKSVPKGPSSSA